MKYVPSMLNLSVLSASNTHSLKLVTFIWMLFPEKGSHEEEPVGLCVLESHQIGGGRLCVRQTVRQHEEMFLFFTNTHLQRERDACI